MLLVAPAARSHATGAGAGGTPAPQFAQAAVPGAPPAGPVRFRAVDVYLDTGGAALAAYQVEVTTTAGHVLLTGLEGGEHAAFRPPPYYDPAVLRPEAGASDRVVVAAFSTAADLPHGRTRVARLHVQVTGDQDPAYATKLQAAATADGKPIPATVTLSPVDAAAADVTPASSTTSPAATEGVTR